MYIAFLWHCRPSQIWWSASHDGSPLNLRACQLFSNSLACWRIICFIGQTQNLTSVYTVVKSVSTWSTYPGSNSPTFTGVWCSVWQQQGTAEGLSWTFSEQNMSRHSYVCFCWPLPRETGTFAVNKQNTGQGWSVHMPQFDDGLQCFDYNPSKSPCTVGQTVGVNRCVMWNGVCMQQLQLFHQQKVQALGPSDYHREGQCAL